MKIQVVDQHTNKPLASAKVQVQIKGSQSGNLTLNTDANGFLQLDDKFKGQQIASTINGRSGSFVTASEGSKLKVETKTEEKLK